MTYCYYEPMMIHRSTPRSAPFEWFAQPESDRPASHLAVLNYAWGLPEFTATDVMAGTGLTRATVIDVLGMLVDVGLVVELANAREAGALQSVKADAASTVEMAASAVVPRTAGVVSPEVTANPAQPAAPVAAAAGKRVYRKGRPARRFAFRPEAGVVVGIDAGYSHFKAIAADLSGNELATIGVLTGHASETETVAEEHEAEERQEAIKGLIDDVLAAAGRSRSELFALCVGVPAPVMANGVSPRHHSEFWQRVNPDLIHELADFAPLVRIENDALLAAVAEGTVGAAQECRSFVALLGGARMGVGVVVDGKLLRGAHGAVGEMHAFEHVRGVDGSRGLGDYAAQLAADAIAAGKVAGADDGAGKPGGAFAGLAPEEVTGRLVFEAIEAGDPDALKICQKVGKRLARIVTVLESFYDPERIVVSGAVGPAALRVLEAARAALPDSVESIVPELVGSSLGAEAVVTGAVAEAVQMARANALDTVLG